MTRKNIWLGVLLAVLVVVGLSVFANKYAGPMLRAKRIVKGLSSTNEAEVAKTYKEVDNTRVPLGVGADIVEEKLCEILERDDRFLRAAIVTSCDSELGIDVPRKPDRKEILERAIERYNQQGHRDTFGLVKDKVTGKYLLGVSVVTP